MSARQELLDLLERLDARDPEHLPVVPLAAYFEGDAERPWREGFAGCAGKPGDGGPLYHRLALLTGRVDVAEARAVSRPGYRARSEFPCAAPPWRAWRPRAARRSHPGRDVHGRR